MKTNPWEHHVWLYPVIIATPDFIAATTLFNISVKVYKIISRATLEGFTQKTESCSVNKGNKIYGCKAEQSIELTQKCWVTGKGMQNSTSRTCGWTKSRAQSCRVIPRNSCVHRTRAGYREIWVTEEHFGCIRFVTNSSPIHQHSHSARQTDYNLNLLKCIWYMQCLYWSWWLGQCTSSWYTPEPSLPAACSYRLTVILQTQQTRPHSVKAIHFLLPWANSSSQSTSKEIKHLLKPKRSQKSKHPCLRDFYSCFCLLNIMALPPPCCQSLI